MSSSEEELLQVATIGRVVGLRGELKLHIQSDFIDQFKRGVEFTLDDGELIEIESYNSGRSLVKFLNYNSRESALRLVNLKLFTTVKETRERCKLKDSEYYWFDIIGSRVLEGELSLGIVLDIDRISLVDYLVVETDDGLLKKGFSKSFYIPYIDRYIESFNLEKREIKTKDAFSLLEIL